MPARSNGPFLHRRSVSTHDLQTTPIQKSTCNPAKIYLLTIQAYTNTSMFKRKHSIDTLISNPKRTAIRVGLQSPGIQLPVDIATASASGPTGLAFRISNIPSCITQDQFLQIVGRLGVNMPFDVGLPAPGYQNLLAWSFAPSVASADSEKYRTATVTFKLALAEF